MQTFYFTSFFTNLDIGAPPVIEIIGWAATILPLPLKQLKKKRAASSTETGQRPLPAPPENALDPWDYHSKFKLKSLRDSENSPPPEENSVQNESTGLHAGNAKSRSFLRILWDKAQADPRFLFDPFRVLSSLLHKETHTLNERIRDKDNWELADRECLLAIKQLPKADTCQSPRCKTFFLCPPEDLQNNLFLNQDPWVLAGDLLGSLQQDKPVATCLPVNERLGRLVFGSLGLGLVKMLCPDAPKDTTERSQIPFPQIIPGETELWPDQRSGAFKRVYDYQISLKENIPARTHESLMEILQAPEAIWELNQRGGTLVDNFRQRTRQLYETTDREVIQTLAAKHNVKEEEIRFSPSKDPYKTFQLAVGRHITYQIRAKPGEKILAFDDSKPGSFHLREAEPGEIAWIDLPSDEVRPIYQAVFFMTANAMDLKAPHTPETFSKAMGQIFGDRLPAESFGKIPR
jgi:hypothetical protein